MTIPIHRNTILENNWIAWHSWKQSKDSICIFVQPTCLVLQGLLRLLTWLNYKFVLLNRPRLLKSSTWCWWCMPCQKRQDGICRTKHSGGTPSQLSPFERSLLGQLHLIQVPQPLILKPCSMCAFSFFIIIKIVECFV